MGGVDRKPVDLDFLMSRWGIETHTLVTAWGEFVPTMEDVALLTSLPMFGEAQVTNLPVLTGENNKRIEALTSFLSKTKYSMNKSTYLSWAKYFMEGHGQNSPHQLDAFLTYWLNYFVFPSSLEVAMSSFVFPMAIALAQVMRLALGPWYLALYMPNWTSAQGTSHDQWEDMMWCLTLTPTSCSYFCGKDSESSPLCLMSSKHLSPN